MKHKLARQICKTATALENSGVEYRRLSPNLYALDYDIALDYDDK